MNTDTPGASPGYVLTNGSLSEADAQKLIDDCRAKYPPPTLSDDDIRAVYDRWVRERQCVVGLGYHPMEPPTFETFLSTWKTGPWDPLTGVDTGSWTDLQYQAAKKACTLEFFTMEPPPSAP